MVARLRNRFPIPFVFLTVVFFAGASRLSRGQTPDAEPTLAGSVASSTRVFVSLSRLDEVDRALRKAKSTPLFSFLGVKPAEGDEFDIKSLLQILLGAKSSIPKEDLMRCEIALASESWSQLADPILLVRAADKGLLERWFPQHAQQGFPPDSARVFRAEDGRFVCVRGRVVALAPRSSDWMQLGSVLRAMAGPEADVLEKSASYRELIAYLPGRPLATIYFAGRTPQPLSATAGFGISGRLAVGIYEKDGTIDIAVRGSRDGTSPRQPLGVAGVARLLKLPQTTLGAYLTTVDWPAMAASGEKAPGAWQRYSRLLTELSKDEGGASDAAPRMGRHVLVAWGQDFSAEGSTPQLAALIESPDATRVAAYARRVAESLTRVLSTLELRDVAADVRIEQGTHLGVGIASISLRKYADKSRFAWVRALAALEPCWAATGEWFIVALTRDHLHRILDAQIGFLGSLSDQREMRALRERPQQYVGVAFLQGTLAAATLRNWERSLRSADLGAVFAKIWRPAGLEDPDRLGVDVSDTEHFGMVEVASVAPNSPSDGRLLAGDRIFGVDGRLLELAQPLDDLQHWWDEVPPGSSHTLRVLRGDEVLELEVMRRFDEVSLDDLFSQPIDLLHELSALSEAIPFATLHVHHTGDPYVSALLSLRLSAGE